MMRFFDTRDTKPRLRHILVLSIVTVLLTAFLILFVKDSAAWVNLLIGFYYVLVEGLLIYSFIEQMRYNPYSYNTIYYSGFALFVLALLVFQITVMANYYRNPEFYTGMQAIYVLSSSAKTYIFLSFPFLFLFCVALCISNIVLLQKEGKSFVNVLGIILSALVIGGSIFLFFRDYYVTGSQMEVFLHDLLSNVLACIYLYFECMLLGTMISAYIVTRHVPEYDRDYMIILGCGMKKDGTPYPLLKGRIDAALNFYEKQKNASGKVLKFVTSGGQGESEPISESRCMKNYLMEHGIKEDEIIEEDQSTSTYENMLYSKEKIDEENKEAKISFATSNFHVFRAGIFARRVKMRATGIGAKTKWYFWPNAAVREFIGLLSKHKGKQAAILIGMLCVCVALTLLEFR